MNGVRYGRSVSRTLWTVHGETVVDENRHIRLSTVDVELPDGVRFTQYVVRMPRCAMTLVLNENREALLMYRHRFIIDQWVWELPGGYVDHAEDVALAAAREVEEETGWRPRTMESLVTYQPAIGTMDHPQEIYLARGADFDRHSARYQRGRGHPLDFAGGGGPNDRTRRNPRRGHGHRCIPSAQLARVAMALGDAERARRTESAGVVARADRRACGGLHPGCDCPCFTRCSTESVHRRATRQPVAELQRRLPIPACTCAHSW